ANSSRRAISWERSSRSVSRIVRSSGIVSLAAARSKNLDIWPILAEPERGPAPQCRRTGGAGRRVRTICSAAMRSILLWMARNQWLRERLPKLWFARRAVRRFMPGEDAESGLGAAGSFAADGIAVMFPRLGENVTKVEEGDAVAEHYLGLLDTIAERGIAGEVSVKLTQLGYDLDRERALAHCERLAERAAAQGRTLWVDME